MGGRIRFDGVTRADALIVLVVLIVLGSYGYVTVGPGLRHIRTMDARARCGTNLSSIGKAMLMYGKDHDDLLPVAGGQATRWGTGLRDWGATDRHQAFALDPNGTGGEATVSSSLYLLVRLRYGDITSRTFLCEADKGVKEFAPAACGRHDKELTEFWDFGPNPTKHCSYAYQMVYNSDKLTTRFESHEAGFAIAADRNPWMDSPFAKAKDFSRFRPDLAAFGGTNDQARCGNTFRHEEDGQNVLFLDSHVEFARRAFCGVADDNIYTISGNQTGGDPLGTPPKLGSQPANLKDSLLVNDPPAPRK